MVMTSRMMETVRSRAKSPTSTVRMDRFRFRQALDSLRMVLAVSVVLAVAEGVVVEGVDRAQVRAVALHLRMVAAIARIAASGSREAALLRGFSVCCSVVLGAGVSLRCGGWR